MFLIRALTHFQHVPKTGGTSVHRLFDNMGWKGGGDILELDSFRKMLRKDPMGIHPDPVIVKKMPQEVLQAFGDHRWWRSSHQMWWEFQWFEDVLGLAHERFPNLHTSDFKHRFSFFRPALDHALSWYRFLWNGHDHVWHHLVCHGTTFSEFLDRSIDLDYRWAEKEKEDPRLKVLPRWHHQSRYVWDHLWTGAPFSTEHEMIPFDDLQKYFHTEPWLDVIDRMKPSVAMPAAKWCSFPHENSTFHSGKLPHPPYDYLSNDGDTLEKLQHLYREDLENIPGMSLAR